MTSVGLACLFLLLLVGAVLAGLLPPLLAVVYVVASAGTFVMYARDKAAARSGHRRTPERTLHAMSAAGGWPGALAAQALLRHKTRKRRFRLVFWVAVLCNCGVLGWALYAPVAEALRTALG